MLTFHSCISLFPPRFSNLHCFRPITPVLSFFSSLSSAQSHGHKSVPDPDSRNPFILDYLIDSFGFPKLRALTISNRFHYVKTSEKPQSVVEFFKSLGFSDAHILSAVRGTPQILFGDVERTLKPKLQFFQDLGLSGPDLGKFISRNSTLLTRSLDKKLKPCITILQKILVNDDDNQELIRVLRRCNWVAVRDPHSRLSSNVSYLQSCGIFGSQLAMLLRRQPWLFAMPESLIRGLVSRVLDMGFLIDSRMLVHAIYTVSCMSKDTFMGKLQLFQSFGFSEDECMDMFRRAPPLLRTSGEKLKFGIDFLLNTVKLQKSALVHWPTCLMHSMEERVVPRYRVVQVLKSKRLFKKEPRFTNVLGLTEKEFLDKYISKYRDDAEELLVVYKGQILDSSDE